MAGIFWDMDGTLTGFPNGFVSKYFHFNNFPNCQASETLPRQALFKA